MSIDETARLKLGVLADSQEMTPAELNDSLAMLDTLVDCYLLGQYVNTPPASPADGDTYIVGGTPTGAWAGYAYKIAYCLDGGWRFLTPFNGLRAFLATSNAFIFYQGGSWLTWNPALSAAEASVASAATTDLGAAGALFVCITGTTAITSFGAGANALRFVRFAGALTLTHNGTTLALLGGASRTTAAGDFGLYASDAGGNWRERGYWRAAVSPADYATRSGSETLANKTLAAPVITGLLSVAASGDETDEDSASLNIGNAATGKMRFYAGINNSGGYCYVGSVLSHIGYNALVLNPNGGAVSIGATAPVSGARLDVAGNIYPHSDNSYSLGSASYRFSTLYAGSGAINTSAAETKTAIAPLSDAELKVARRLAGLTRLYQFRDAVAAKGPDAARRHAGQLYEDVAAAFTAEGLDPFRYGVVCRDGAGDNAVCGLRYDELAQFILAGLAARIAALEAA